MKRKERHELKSRWEVCTQEKVGKDEIPTATKHACNVNDRPNWWQNPRQKKEKKKRKKKWRDEVTDRMVDEVHKEEPAVYSDT